MGLGLLVLGLVVSYHGTEIKFSAVGPPMASPMALPRSVFLAKPCTFSWQSGAVGDTKNAVKAYGTAMALP